VSPGADQDVSGDEYLGLARIRTPDRPVGSLLTIPTELTCSVQAEEVSNTIGVGK
jgi:hypothetical protein